MVPAWRAMEGITGDRHDTESEEENRRLSQVSVWSAATRRAAKNARVRPSSRRPSSRTPWCSAAWLRSTAVRPAAVRAAAHAPREGDRGAPQAPRRASPARGRRRRGGVGARATERVDVHRDGAPAPRDPRSDASGMAVGAPRSHGGSSARGATPGSRPGVDDRVARKADRRVAIRPGRSIHEARRPAPDAVPHRVANADGRPPIASRCGEGLGGRAGCRLRLRRRLAS